MTRRVSLVGRRWSTYFFPSGLLLLGACTLFAADINPKTYLSEVAYLASPELKGRATGSPELEKAAHYIESRFRVFRLEDQPSKLSRSLSEPIWDPPIIYQRSPTP